MPEALLIRPDTPPHLDAAVEAFRILSRSRPMAVGMGGAIALPIKASEAIAMAHAIDWPPLDFLRVIAPADALYVEHTNSRATSGP